MKAFKHREKIEKFYSVYSPTQHLDDIINILLYFLYHILTHQPFFYPFINLLFLSTMKLVADISTLPYEDFRIYMII